MAMAALVFIVGGSETDRGDDLADRIIDIAVGQNRVSGYIENTFSNLTAEPENNDTLVLYKEIEDASIFDDEFVASESVVQGGDSGGPVFFQDADDPNSSLVLLGVNSVRGQVTFGDGTNRNFTGVGYVGNRATALNDFIAANAVPEPGSAAILLGGLCWQVFRRRRHSLV